MNIECNCDQENSESTTCADETGQCHCKERFGGKTCGECFPGYTGDGCFECSDTHHAEINIINNINVTGACVSKYMSLLSIVHNFKVQFHLVGACNQFGTSEKLDGTICSCKEKYFGPTCDQCRLGSQLVNGECFGKIF